MFVFENLFFEIAVLLAISAVVAAIGISFRQPLIVAFMAVGVLVGPAALDWIHSNDRIDLLAQLGIALLLFIVGLKLDLHIIRSLGTVALATGLGQVAFTAIIGFVICLFLDFSTLSSVYIAVALTFSSTIIIVKLLSDKKEIDALHGRIAVGLLIVQDVVVIVAMIALASIGKDQGLGALGASILSGVAFLVALAAIAKYIFPRLLPMLARSTELLVLFSVAWAVSLAALGEILGFSREVGAFLAGVTLASTSYREAVASRLVSLRDFLLLFFFVDLGARLDLSVIGDHISAAIILSFFVLVGNPLIVMIIMGYMGYRKRTGFLVGLTVAQISEFSLILAALGVSLGHIEREILGLITVVGLVTISASTYMIYYSHLLFDRIAPLLNLFERRRPYRETMHDANVANVATIRADVILFGCGRFGTAIATELSNKGYSVFGVDFHPETVRVQNASHFPIRYGDAEDPEFVATLPIQETQMIVSSLRNLDLNVTLILSLRHSQYTGPIAVTAHSAQEAEKLREAGANIVILPFSESAKAGVDQISRWITEHRAHAQN